MNTVQARRLETGGETRFEGMRREVSAVKRVPKCAVERFYIFSVNPSATMFIMNVIMTKCMKCHRNFQNN